VNELAAPMEIRAMAKASSRLHESIRVDCAASTLAALGLKEAEMRLIGCDLHASQQSIATLDRDTGEIVDAGRLPY
jgi:hypothetical protein